MHMNYNLPLLKNKIKQIDTFFFDLDGTLIDTEKLYCHFWKIASKEFGRELSDIEALHLRSLEHNSGVAFFKSINMDYDKVRDRRIELMKEYFLTHDIEIKDGAIELLEKLKKENKKIYIVTANTVDKAKDILIKTKLDKYVDDIISAKNVNRGKPYPDVYIYAYQKLNKKPSEVMVFEDSPNGLKASHLAEIFTVMVEDMTTFTSDMDYVDASISDLKQIL